MTGEKRINMVGLYKKDTERNYIKRPHRQQSSTHARKTQSILNNRLSSASHGIKIRHKKNSSLDQGHGGDNQLRSLLNSTTKNEA